MALSTNALLGPPARASGRMKIRDVPCGTVTNRADRSRERGVPPVPGTFPETPSRPGRLVAVTACPARHETPGTHLGRPEPPRGINAAAGLMRRRPPSTAV